jgi:hypothetical protein
VKPFIPYLLDNCWDFLIAILGLASGIFYVFFPNRVGNCHAEQDRKKNRWFGVIFTAAGIFLLVFLMVGWLNSN